MTHEIKKIYDNDQNQLYDVCIIGSGMCGQIIANELRKKKKKIIIVESGKYDFDRNIQTLDIFNSQGLSFNTDSNQSYNNELVRQFGGSANHWGNQIMFFNKIDLLDRPWIYGNLKWHLSPQELEQYYIKILKILYKKTFCDNVTFDDEINLKYLSSFDKQFTTNNDFIFPYSYHPENIEKFNLKSKFSKELFKDKNITILINSTVTKLNFKQFDYSIESIEVRSKKDKKKIKSKIFILCAGAMENARILMNNSIKNSVLKNHSLGHYFMEHPRINIGYFDLKKKIPLSSMLGIKSKSINFRQALRFNEIFQSKHEILNSHINISPIFEKQETEFFIKFLKKIKSLISLKKLCLPYVENFKIKQFVDQLYFIPHRVSNKYLNYLMSKYFLFSKHYFSFEKLSVDYHGEQAPNYNSKIYLNNSKDIFDQYSLNVDWQLNEFDYRTIKKFSDYFRSMDNEIFEFKINKDIKIVNQKHRMGTTRMGDTKKDGVVDMNCKVFDVKNLYISGGSVFKTSSSSNPGITIMAMALRLAEYLNKS